MKFLVIPLVIISLFAAGEPSANAATLLFDDFSGSAATNLNGTTPDTGSVPWTSKAGAFNVTGVIRTDGSIAATEPQTAWLATPIEAGYTYTLTSIVDQTYNSASTAYGGIGFTSAPGTVGDAYVSASDDYGLLKITRAGTWNFFAGPNNNGSATASGTGLYTAAVNDYELKLVLDTTVANWTLAGFAGGTQLDLNGAGAGSLFTYTTNPTLSGVGLNYVANSTTLNYGSLTLDAVPEPCTGALLGLGLGMLWSRSRRDQNRFSK